MADDIELVDTTNNTENDEDFHTLKNIWDDNIDANENTEKNKNDNNEPIENNEDKSDEEWPSYSIKFEYYDDQIKKDETDTVNQQQNIARKNRDVSPNEEMSDEKLASEKPETLIERFKIALTFLLHDMSPIWNNNINDEYKENNSIYPKGNLSMKNINISYS
eukprot:52227_1